ncbi:MAG: hypothetical protein WA090_03845 [Candidatus Nanopelagicaceae bacterium]
MNVSHKNGERPEYKGSHIRQPIIGPSVIFALVILEGIFWFVYKPNQEPWGRFIGQFLGAEAIPFLTIGLVLISSLAYVERWFNGINRAAIWHRRSTMTGMILTLMHS